MSHPLAPLLAPRSIAFVGASPRPDTVGSAMLQVIERGGFGGRIFPVNPKYDKIGKYPCWPSMAALPEQVDLAVLAVANPRLEMAVVEAIAAESKAAVIFASGYLEGDREPPLTARIARLAQEAGMPICGGNGMGFYNDVDRVWVGAFPT